MTHTHMRAMSCTTRYKHSPGLYMPTHRLVLSTHVAKILLGVDIHAHCVHCVALAAALIALRRGGARKLAWVIAPRVQLTGGAGREGTTSRARVAAPSRILSDCTYMWERTVMGISVRTAETETATPPY